jgi:polyisoprenoid-binding protein YceI
MKIRIASLVAFLTLLPSATLLAADTYKVDPVHSMVVFQINHMGVSNVLGRFNAPAGTFVMDDDAANMSFQVTVPAANVDTNNAQRDTHLKSESFFDAKQFPDITFKSTAIKKTGDKTYDVTGDLTLHGVTKSITVPLNLIGTASTQQGDKAGFGGTFSIKRSDYGMTFMIGGVGDDVTLWVNLEGTKQ